MLHQFNNLPAVKQERLRRLLDSEGLDVLIEVIESRGFVNECQAANALLEDRAGYDSKAKEFIKAAMTEYACISILTELRNFQSLFSVATAKPSTKTPTE